MKTKRLVDFDKAPGWLSHIEIEREGDDIKFTLVRRSDTVLGTFTIDIDKMIRHLYQFKKED